ncbi:MULTISPECIES: TetR/AcrR family transcriptional regulator [Acidithiobacillus]|uniref:Transcriptional regulator, TetR family n=3 Tax=Acidithiobacillus caldus TaxID=33059 RepID=F9ZQS3_ACICS|nr:MULTISPECIES: TetR/AcrR family transcriptional regulator [Acidithiobacillus]AEK59262.1 transcriptional regulator, TetR family [Acidithiobacillus caldus SM-1]AIA56305.1 Transcriptional regulator, TetR family [Acidithiobacillus caldus ATCC 51756]AUW33644.1 TetR/AcrR family transcriptional regulator [Acidithiobacillus caldus]MBU2730080.1 TetR/AcrR family transcriptional regulator [Acidithiobacillus caldus]MBU2735336.1 TetR/AcrR family transcriptional regulator [Acidithiobacillus caldus ATCC 51
MHDAEMDPTAGDGSRRILDAAEELFADRGFDAVSMHAIAQAAGISKANIYHYFPNKDALYLAVLRSASENLRALLQEAINSHGSVRDILHHFANSHLQALLKRPRLVRLVWREILEKGAPRAKELAEQGFGELFGNLVGLIRSGQERGELRAEIDPAVAAILLIAGNVFFFQHRDTLRHYPEVSFVGDPEAYDRAMVELLLLGIAAPNPPS